MDASLLQERNSKALEPIGREPETSEQNDFRGLGIESPRPPLRITFDPPIEFDNEKYSQITCDFDGMIGKDFSSIQSVFLRLYKGQKNEVIVPEMTHEYVYAFVSHVGKVPPGLVKKLPRRYYTPLRNEVLKACGSSPDEENE